MDKLQELYGALKESGDVTVGFDEFKGHYSVPENKKALYGALKESGDVTVPFEEFDGYYFTPEKKNPKQIGSVDAGVGLETVSQNTEIPSVAPKNAFKYGNDITETPVETVAVAATPVAEQKPIAKDMVDIFGKFQEMRGKATIAAQENTMKAAQGDLEAVRKQREAHPERYKGLDEKGKQEMYAKEEARAEEIRNNPQPLTTRLLEYYRENVGAPNAAGDRSQRALAQFNAEVVGTPKGAELEQRLQKIYKTVKPGDSRSLENALLDAKELVLKSMGDKDSAIWEDLAKTNANFADYDPYGYHERLNNQIKEKYSNAGLSEGEAYDKLREYTLERGVMDEDRTHEAKLMMDADNLAKDLQRAKDEGNQLRIDAAQYQYDQAVAGIQGMQKERLAAVDKEIADIKGLMTMENPPRPMAELKAGLAKAEAAKAGFINPYAKVEAAYAKYQEKADSAKPEGTPLEKLKKLYAELEWDRQQTARRIVEAEGGGVRGGANEMLNSFSGIVRSAMGHNDDHRRLVELDAQIKDLAPIVFLNESPAIRDEKAGFFPSFFNGLLTTLGGKGSPLSGSSRQEDAIRLLRNLQIAGVSPEMLNDPTLNGIAERTKEPGLADSEYWGNLLGNSSGLMIHILLMQQLTKGIGMGTVINSLVKAGQTATKAGKVGGATLALLGDAMESGLNYHGAGMISVDNNDELSFAGGFFGGAAASLGKQGFNAASKVVAGLFGDKAADAVKVISDFGAKRIGAGIGESFEETGQQITQMWQQSNTGQEFWDKMNKQFGDIPEAVKFYVSTMVMGMGMGSAHSDGFGKYLEDYAKQQLDNMGPEDRAIAEDMTHEIENEAQDLIAGARSEDAPPLVLTPEAEAAQAELEKSRAVAESMGEGAEGRTIEDSVPEGSTLEQHMADRMDEDIRALETRLENPDISPGLREKLEAEIEQKKKAKIGFEQMRDNTAFVEETKTAEENGKAKPKTVLEDLAAQGVMLDMEDVGALENDQQIPGKIYDTDGTEIKPSDPRYKAAMETIHNWIQDGGTEEVAVEETESPAAETITTDSGETIESVEGSPTKKKVTLGSGIELEIDTDGLAELLDDGAQSVIEQSFMPTEEVSTSPATQENTTEEQAPKEQPKRRDQEIVDQINEFFGNLAGTISENSKEQLNKYARRILAGEDPTKVMQGQTPASVELVNQAVAAIQSESAPATDESIVDVTEEAPTPIAAEETVVTESLSPVTQKKGKGGTAAGKSKPKANPNRRTKSKPVTDLSPTEVVSEAIAASAEVDENPTPENKEREAQIEQKIADAAISEAETVDESPGITQEEAQLAEELEITPKEVQNAKKGDEKRTRKSKAVVEVIESQAADAIASGDAAAAEEVLAAIEGAESAILGNVETSDSFEDKHGVSEVELANEYNSLGKNATIEQAYENVTGKALRGFDAQRSIDSDEQKAAFKEFITDFINAISRAGIKLKHPLDVGHDIVIDLVPKPVKPVKKTGVDATNNNVAADQDKAALTGIYFDGDQMVATDANQLVIIRIKESAASIIDKFKAAIVKARSKALGLKGAQAEADRVAATLTEEGLDGKILNFNGGTIVDQRYPNYKSVIPAEDTAQSKPIPIQQLIDVVNGAAVTLKNLAKDSFQRPIFVIRLSGEMDLGMNPELLLRNLQTLQANGATSVVIGATKANRGVNIYANNGNRGLIMPIMLGKVDRENVITTTPYEIDTVPPKNQSVAQKEKTAKTEDKTTNAPKQKAKSRGKEQFDEGVEDQFIVANIRGTRTAYRKKNGVWESREHKGKISENKFRNEWTPVDDEDISFVERMAAKDPLDLEVANAAKEWIAAWGNFVKLRWAGDGKMFSGEVFSRPDLGLAEPIGKIMVQTVKLGVAVAKQLAAKGAYTKANWEEGMRKFVGDHVQPLLSSAWDAVQAAFPEGSSIEQIEAAEESKPKEKSKKAKQKRGERGTYRTMEQYEEDNGGAIKQVLDTVNRSYKRMNFGELFDSAAKAVSDAGGFIKDFGNMMADPTAPGEMAMQQAKRMLAIRFFGQLADHLQSEIDSSTDPAQKESLAKLRDMAIKNVDALMTKVAENNTEMGQATATMSQWRFLLENTAGYAQAKIAEYNAELMDPSSKAGKTEAGKKRRQRKKTIMDTVNESVADIETSEAVDQAVDAIENEEEIKPKKTRETKPKKDYTKTKEKIAKAKAEGLALMQSAVRKASGSLQSGGLMAIPEFVEGASKYGFALVAEGAITFKEWADKMRSAIPDMTDSDIQEVWDTAVDEDGKSLSDTAAEEVKKAATPKKRTAKQKVTLRGKIRKAINDHFKKDAEPMTLAQRLIDDVDLTADEAALVVEAVQAELDARLKKKLDQRVKSLKRKKPTGTKSKPKTDTERVVEALTDGSLTDDMVNDIFADRIGLQTPLDPEQMAKARALGQALSDTKPGSHAERIAAMALDRFMYQVLPGPGGAANFFEIFKSIIYANMLMGIPTHMKNLISSGAMTVSSLVETLANVSKWKRAFRDVWKAKDGEKMRMLLRSSPLTEMMVKFAAIGRGIAKGAPIAWDIMAQGFVDSKYVTQGKAQAGRLSPILERQKFGRGELNPMNWFKYVGRALSAEDAWMTAINSEMELADAVRRHFLDSSVRGGIAPLTRDVSRRMAKSNPEYASALAQAEIEIDSIAGALELTPAERARAIKIKANELLVESLGLTEEERQQAEDIAKSRVFTLTRNGIWGKTAQQMNKINAHKVFGKVSWIWMPFTTIIGNIGDTFNDYAPLYGLARANGISPTGMFETSAMMSNRLEGSTMDRAKKLLGSRNDQRYYEQMGRAWFGAISLLLAGLLMGEDDDDDAFIRLTGKDNAEYKNFIVIGGVPIVSWELIPSVAPVAAIISEMQSFHKQHPKEDRSLGRRVMYAMGAVEQSIAGMSVAESIQSLNQVVGTLISSATGVGNYGNPVDLQKGITTMLKDLGKQGIDVLGRVNPLRNAIVGQIHQIFDPRVFSHSDLDQSLEYAALGALYRTRPDNEGKDKMAMVDIFGEEVKRLPADDVFGFLSWFKEDKMKDPKWKFLTEHGLVEMLRPPRNSNMLFTDDEDEFGVVSKKMTEHQYGTFARLAGKNFSNELTRYMANTEKVKQDYGLVDVTNSGTSTQLKTEVMKLLNKSRTQAKKDMDRMPISQGGFGNTRK